MSWHTQSGRDFRLLWLGQTVSILGDQFYLVALPWLVLYLTGSGLVLGTILLTATVTKVAFQLVGGATSDMLSQRKLMIVSSSVRAVVCALLTVLVQLNRTHLWHLFIIVAVFGTADAFFSPAFKAFIPTVIDKEDLVAGNSLMNGSAMLAMFIGPSLAGILIATAGTGAAFGLDTVSFVFVLGCLLLMRRHSPSISPREEKSAEHRRTPRLFTSIGAGLRYVWHEPTLRALIIITAVVEFAFAGPFTVGLASLANIKFAGGAVAFGAMLSALGGGLVLGTLVVGATQTRGDFGNVILWLTSAMAVGLILLGLVPNVVWACVLMAAIGIIGGYSQVLVATWLQTKSDPQMRGRVMSIVILGANSLTPLSYVLTGALTHISVSFMFVVIGASLLITLALCAFGWSRPPLDPRQST